MLLGGQSITLGSELCQSTTDAETGVARLDDIVDIAILGCLIRISEQLVVLFFLLSDEGLDILAGFLPGTQQEFGGVILHGAKLLYAFGEATVPKVTVTLRKSYGGSHIVMSCKQLRGDMNYAWPTANIAVMGADGAVAVLYSKDIKAAATPEEAAEIKEAKKKEYDDLFCNPYKAASYGYIDDVIEPRNTRFRVIRALVQLRDKNLGLPAKKHGNIPL